MIKFEIIAAGRLKKGPLHEIWLEYLKRLRWPLILHEIESRQKDPAAMNAEENAKIEKFLKDSAFVVILDEKGKSLGSLDFAKTLEKAASSGRQIQFVLGGADGLSPAVKKKASLVLSFGAQTWPHMLARVMLLEQIYRAQQILNGHPYHRE